MYEYGIILAGGKSSRMGRDKALLPFGGAPSMTHYLYASLAPLFQHLFVAAKEDKFDGDFPIILDKKPLPSPLVALVSAFDTLPAERLFVVSVDTPFVDASVVRTLYDAANKDTDAVIAATGARRHPLCGVYARSCLPEAHNALAENRHKLHDLLTKLQTRTVPFAADDPRFANLNRPEEYEAALARFT